MKAIRVEAVGGPEELRYVDVPVPAPAAGQVLVKLAAIGINYIDTYHRSGLYPVPLPFVPGSEAAGTVEALGPGVEGFSAGDRVAYAMVRGAYAEYAVAPAASLVPLPDAVSFRDAAALMLQGMTAHYLCRSAFPLEGGNVALAHAGAGGVGLLLTQFAKSLGATVITTVSTAEKAELSREAGADHVVRYDSVDFAAEALASPAAAASTSSTTASARPRSPRASTRCVRAACSRCTARPAARCPRSISANSRRKARCSSRVRRSGTTWPSPTNCAGRSQELFAALIRGTLKLRVEHVYPLEHAARAHADLEARKTPANCC